MAAWGNRWEVGYVDDNNYGWMVGVLDHVAQVQYHNFGSTQVLFNDPGNLLTTGTFRVFETVNGVRVLQQIGIVHSQPDYTSFAAQNVTTLNGTEITRIYRAPRLHNGSYFELLYGARWLQVDDAFSTFGVGGLLDESSWSARAINNIVVAQIGGRWFRQRGRWVTSIEARAMAGANFQSVQEKATLGTNIQSLNTATGGATVGSNITVPTFITAGFGNVNSSFATQFSPVGELRLNVAYQVTRSVALKVGFTSLAVGNITRASNRISYDGPQLIGITNSSIHQSLFVNGVNFGVEVNR